jgi:hypothetical protein
MDSEIVEAGSLKPRSEKIILQTRKGNSIINKQIIEDTHDEDFIKTIRNIKANHIGAVARPNTISKIYNCHGMIFASRRTGIDQLDEIGKILYEDNYKPVDTKNILAGDIVLYFEENGEISHSGLVIIPAPNHSFIAETFILSKWGDSCEVIHGLYNCPYPFNVKFYRCTN